MRHRSGIQMFSPTRSPSSTGMEVPFVCRLSKDGRKESGRVGESWSRHNTSTWLACTCFQSKKIYTYTHTNTHNTLTAQRKTAGCSDNIASFAPGANKISKTHSSQERDGYMLGFQDPTQRQSFPFPGSPTPVLPGTSRITFTAAL